MKRFKITGILFAALLVFSSCDKDFEEINQDPNNPISLPAHLLMPTAIRNGMNEMYSTFTGGDMGSCWSQQFAKVQYNDEARYIPRQSIIARVWTTFYANVISQADAMYTLAEAEGNNNMMGVALVIQAQGYQVLTDLYGDVPFTEALSTEQGIIAPAYDAQSGVYSGIIDMLTRATSLLGTGGSIDSGSDILYGGDAGLWAKYANSLKFRALMRISGATSVGPQLQALVNGGNMFSSNADEAKLVYLGAAPNANPLYETIVFGTRGEWKVNSVLVEMMEANNDPRLPQYAQKNDANIYRGKPSGLINLPNTDYNYTNVSAIGEFYLQPETPGYYMSNAELHFLMAEAVTRGLISGDAAAHFEAGMTASFEANEVDGSAYVAANVLGTLNPLKQIGEEKWLALFAQGLESWTEQKRTGYPVLTPALEGELSQIPSRVNYPEIEQSINGANYNAAVAAQGADNLTTPLWWMN